MQKLTNLNDLPKWMIPDPGTVELDVVSPSERYLIGDKEAKVWRYPFIDENPTSHIYNLYNGGFFESLKTAYSLITYSESRKDDFLHLYGDKDGLNLEENYWTGAPLQAIANRVGARLLPGLKAISLLTGEDHYYQGSKNWFIEFWLPKADEIAKKYYQTPRGISRTMRMGYLIVPHMDAIRDKFIEINDDLLQKHPEIKKHLCVVSKEDFDRID